MQTTRREDIPHGLIVGVGILVTAVFVGTLTVLFSRSSYDIWGALVIGPILIVVTLPLLSRQATREGDRRTFVILLAALVLKFMGALARYYVVFVLYGGKGDSRAYHLAGIDISNRFRSGNFDPGVGRITDTSFIKLLTGIVYTITRPTLLGGFIVFTWFAFLGMFFFYRAFTIAVPFGNRRVYAALLFFLPSMLFWSSSTGKEAWLTFAMGLSALGAAKVLTKGIVRGAPLVLLGLVATAFVRGHTAGIVAIALALAMAFRKPVKMRGEAAIAARVLTIGLAVGLGVVFFVYAFTALRGEGIDTSGGVSSILQQTTDRTAEGGSEFTPHLATSPTGVVLGTLTVLFRPLVIEATSIQTLGSALEGAALILFCLVRWRWLASALRNLFRTSYLVYAAAAAAGLIVSLTSIANFGILARQRVTLFPFFLVLLAIPPTDSSHDDQVKKLRSDDLSTQSKIDVVTT
jgi:hypothetical protein